MRHHPTIAIWRTHPLSTPTADGPYQPPALRPLQAQTRYDHGDSMISSSPSVTSCPRSGLGYAIILRLCHHPTVLSVLIRLRIPIPPMHPAEMHASGASDQYFPLMTLYPYSITPRCVYVFYFFTPQKSPTWSRNDQDPKVIPTGTMASKRIQEKMTIKFY